MCLKHAGRQEEIISISKAKLKYRVDKNKKAGILTQLYQVIYN